MIYALEILHREFVKIGYTSREQLRMRIAQLQTGSPYEIKPICIVEGTLQQEQMVHQALRVGFGRIRIPVPPNEWYPGKPPFMREVVASLAADGVKQMLALLDRYSPSVKQPGHCGDASNFDLKLRWGIPPKR